MLYLHKMKSDEGILKYEYGAEDGNYVGNIQLKVNVPADTSFENRDLKLEFYGENKFSSLTSSALQGIAKFIRINDFPENYLRATH